MACVPWQVPCRLGVGAADSSVCRGWRRVYTGRKEAAGAVGGAAGAAGRGALVHDALAAVLRAGADAVGAAQVLGVRHIALVRGGKVAASA